ncbi:MAG: hypothetical protein ABFD54_00665 [Armatimonadota bacterium]|nr:hypothetical protein [bacterium]
MVDHAPVLGLPVKLAMMALVLLGILGVVVGFVLSPLEEWLWLLVGFVVFVGIANGMLAWAAIFRVAQARWTPVIIRIAQSALAFMPVMGIVLIALLAGVSGYMPWVAHSVRGKGAWLNVLFLVVREVLSLGVFWVLCWLMVRWNLIADEKVNSGEEITEREHFRMNAISVAVVMWYAVASTLVSWDFIMSLSPEWVSTMFAPYYFCTNIFAAMGVMIIASAVLRKIPDTQPHLKPGQFNDMGNLMLAFALFDMGLFFAQYLTIWYENLPEETPFLLIRYMYGPWPVLGWMAFAIAYAIPFVLLQSRIIKMNAKPASGVAVLALLGFMLERYVLVVPSLRPDKLMIAPVGVLTLLGFIGALALSMAWFLGRCPLISGAQAVLAEVNKGDESI